MLVDPSSIRPSQDFLKQKTIEYILSCIHTGNSNDLPPPPIVRKDSNGDLIAIDGHNLIAVRHFLKQNVEVHIAASAKDFVPENSDADKLRNKMLKEKFDTCLVDQSLTEEKGIKNFEDLIARFPDYFGPTI